jgi:hypothetical protein
MNIPESVKPDLNSLKLLVAIFLAGVAAGFYIHLHYFTEKPQQIIMTDFQQKNIVQQARAGYISRDSLQVLMGATHPFTPPKRGLPNFLPGKTDTLILLQTIKDTSDQIQLYSADTTLTFTQTDSAGNSVKIVETINQRFIPWLATFASSFNLDSVIVNSKILKAIEKPELFFNDHWFWATVGLAVIIIIKIL